MADITIEGSAYTSLYNRAGRAGIFWKSTTVGYVIYVNSSVDLKYNKTGDGGATWGGAQNIRTGTIIWYDCYADWQVDGDAGTKIHIAYMDAGTNDVRYCYLDTATDTVGGDDQIEVAKGSGVLGATSFQYNMASITKTRGGNLAVAIHQRDSASANFYSFYTSPDGDTWTSESSPWETAADYIQLYPANLADSNDLWAAFWDVSANEISLKTYDDSGDSWSENSISASMTESISYFQSDGQIRLSDGHLIFAAWNLYDNAAADLMVWDITDGGTITAKTNIITNEAETFQCSVFINQVNDDIYVAYLAGGTAGQTVDCVYQKSTDGGANWGGETILSDNAMDDHRWVSAGCLKASLGGKFAPVWFDDDDNDIFTTTANAVTIAAEAGGGWSGEVCGVAVAEYDGVVPEEICGV